MSHIKPQRFLATTPGLSATRWLSFALALHPEVFAAHGKHPLGSVVHGSFHREKQIDDIESLTLGNKMARFYERLPLEEVFAVYQAIMPQAKAVGNVHTYTIESLLKTVEDRADLEGVSIINVLRHPVSYIASHTSLVRSAEAYPLYEHYSGVMFPQALERFPELLLIECPDYKLFVAFAVSCLSVCNLERDFEHSGFRHMQMEELTTNAAALREFCESLTGLPYPAAWLEGFIAQGGINQHRRASAKRSPAEVFAAWPRWQQDAARMMIPPSVLRAFEENGYDVAMLRSGSPLGKSDAAFAPSLADHLRAAGHPGKQPLKPELSAPAAPREPSLPLNTWAEKARKDGDAVLASLYADLAAAPVIPPRRAD